jgi:iron complex transport system substrate-binding protein
MEVRHKIALAIVITILSSVCPGPASCATFEDALGRKVSLERPPERIITLAPNLTEILYALGLGDRVVGVTNHCNYPPEASLKPKVGSYINLNVEKIISLSPDLAIGTVDGNERIILDLLEQAKIKAFFVNPRSVRQVIDTILALGRLCGALENAQTLTSKLTRRVDHVVERTGSREKPLVFLQIQIQPIMTVNKNTVHNDLIRLAGGRNMAAEEPITYPRISIEEVIQRRPDVILISSMERAGRFERARQEWLKWTSIPAAKNKRVYLIDSDLIDRPSPRLIDGLEMMARYIHPEAFD